MRCLGEGDGATTWDRLRRNGVKVGSAAHTERFGAAVTANDVLGAERPVMQISQILATTDAQSVSVGVVLLGALVAAVSGQAWAVPLAISAGFVLGVLLMAGVGLARRRHDDLLALIIDGHEDVSVAAVYDERQRLLAPATRGRLADVARHLSTGAAGDPLAARASVTKPRDPGATATPEQWRELADRLNHPQEQARGVAAAERLLRSVALSPWRRDPVHVSAELRHAICLLDSAHDETDSAPVRSRA
jgi:hypothetical protein